MLSIDASFGLVIERNAGLGDVDGEQDVFLVNLRLVLVKTLDGSYSTGADDGRRFEV